jgi:NAD(P)-dependent dehydrogenase (short-subunit alcohol dehydrogenase family)
MASDSETGVVLVCGATFGIGRDIATNLASRGYNVLGFGLETAPVSSVANASVVDLNTEAGSQGLSLKFRVADVTDEGQVNALVEDAVEQYGRIYGVVNNAAIGPLGTILDTEPSLWDKIMQVNLKGPYLLCRAAIPHMARAGGGRIVNVGSGAGWGKPNMAAYSTSKGGLIAFSAALALDHFAQRISVNTVIPGGGGIDSGMSRGRVQGDLAKLRANVVGTVAGRYMEGRDLANAVAFLLSSEAEAISGTIIDVGCFAHQGSSVPLGTA